jgi:hypothetical protein
MYKTCFIMKVFKNNLNFTMFTRFFKYDERLNLMLEKSNDL